MIEVVSSHCNNQRNTHGKTHEYNHGHVEGGTDGLHNAMPDAKEQGEAKKPEGDCFCGEDAQEFTQDKEGFGDWFRNHGEHGFVFNLRGEDARGDERREGDRENIDGTHAVTDHENVIVSHGVTGNREVDDEAKKANQDNDHEDRLSDTLREGVPCDREKLLYHECINV